MRSVGRREGLKRRVKDGRVLSVVRSESVVSTALVHTGTAASEKTTLVQALHHGCITLVGENKQINKQRNKKKHSAKILKKTNKKTKQLSSSDKRTN